MTNGSSVKNVVSFRPGGHGVSIGGVSGPRALPCRRWGGVLLGSGRWGRRLLSSSW
ncbi:hypothetical protein Hanom_Chr15g01367741 [Helianthus anomalus]